MRNKVEEAMGGPPIDRLKAKVENFFQGTADVTETTFKSTGIGDFTTRILGNVTDYFAGKDTAFNNGYNNQAAVDYSSDNQDDVYKELFIKDNLYALDKNESKRLKDKIGSKQEDCGTTTEDARKACIKKYTKNAWPMPIGLLQYYGWKMKY